MRVKEIKRISKKDIIIPEYLIRPLEDKEDDDIKDLSESIENICMVHDISVRILENGKYELMAGGRRFQATKDEEISAKIYEDIDTIDAMILGFAENNFRKDIDTNIRDTYIYKLWKMVNDSGKIKYKKEFAKKIGMKESIVNIIIQSGEEKEKYENMDVMHRATTNELYRTRYLKDYPEIRIQLLTVVQNGSLDSTKLEIMSKNFKEYLDEGKSLDDVKTMIISIVQSDAKRRQKVAPFDKKIEDEEIETDNRIKKIQFLESSLIVKSFTSYAKETFKNEMVLKNKIETNKNNFSDFNMHNNNNLESFYAKDKLDKVISKSRTKEMFKNNFSETKMGHNDASNMPDSKIVSTEQKELARKDREIDNNKNTSMSKNNEDSKSGNTISDKYVDREMEFIKKLLGKAVVVRANIIMESRDNKLINEYNTHLKTIIDHLNRERAKILLSQAKFVAEK